MRYKGFDLNPLVAPDALIEEASVSRAAERLGMSQPAMSAALGRLRTYFDDPILGARGKRMIPTAHALTLEPMLRELLSSVESLVSVSSGFDPATSQRHFRIGASDFIATIIFHELMPELSRLAPSVTLELIQPSEAQMQALDQGMLDIVVAPESYTKRSGQRRRIEAMAASFLLAPELLVGTSRLTVTHERLAKVFVKRVPVRPAEAIARP